MIYQYIIYKLIFPNTKVYIGQTGTNLNNRLNSHKYMSVNANCSLRIHTAIKKYGWENVKCEVLCTVSEEFVDDTERYFIKLYNSTDKNFGYNLEDGGCKNKHHSKETIFKLSNMQLGKNNYFYGKKHSEKTKNIMSDKSIGENNSFYGKKHSEETKLKISQSSKNRNCKSVDVFDKNGNFINTFSSLKLASMELNVDRRYITSVLIKKQKTTHEYIFKYNGENK